jgi:hypothetical protein
LNFLRAPFAISQWTSSGGGTITSSTGNYSVHFVGATGLATGNYIVKRHEVQKAVTFPNSFCQVTGAWGRGVGTSGWSQANPNYGEGFCRVVPGTLTTTGVTLRTFVYEVVNVLGQSLGWYPAAPGNVTFAYTVLGVPTPSYAVYGPSIVCASGANANASFTLQNIPAGSSVTWTASSNLTPASGSGATATVSAYGNGKGQITFSIQGACNSTFARTNIQVGKYQVSDFPITGPGGTSTNGFAYVRPNATISLQAPFLSNLATNGYEWTVVNNRTGTQTTTKQNSRYFTVYTPGTGFQSITVLLRIRNICNGTELYPTEPAVYNLVESSSYSAAFTLSPNPADEYVEIAPDATIDGNPALAHPYAVKLYSLFNQEKASAKTVRKAEKVRLDTRHLPRGIYLVHILINDKVIVKQLQITK